MNTENLKTDRKEILEILKSINSIEDINYQGFEFEDDLDSDSNCAVVEVRFNDIKIRIYLLATPPYDLLGAFYYSEIPKTERAIKICILWACISHFECEDDWEELHDEIMDECVRLEEISSKKYNYGHE